MTGTAAVSAAGRHDGYVVDVPYIEPVNSDLCPAWFSLAAVLQGQPPLPRDRELVWAELGSGSGLSAAMVAAANDDVEVWGCDVNPAHVERSRRLATAAGLANCTFDEASFAEVADGTTGAAIGPAEVDVVVIHGVYSWISPANQRNIARFVQQRLRPGGLVYVSYEVPSGWASMVPIAEAMRLHVEADGRRSDVAFPGAVAAIQHLAEGGARHFPLGPNETLQLADLPSADVRYAVHEYLGEHFRPLMFDEVAATFASARCTHVGSLWPVDHLSAFWVPEPLKDLVTSIDDPVLQGMVRDVVTQRQLRRDLFRKGAAPLTRAEHEAALDEVRLVGLDRTLPEGAWVAVPVGQANLEPTYYQPVLDALAAGPVGLADIAALHPQLGRDDVVAMAALLVSGGYAAPEVPRWRDGSVTARARHMNQALVAENALGRNHFHMVAPAVGAAVEVNHFEMLTAAAVWDGIARDVSALAPHVLDSVRRQGRSVLEDGVPVEDPDRALLLVEQSVPAALARLDGYLSTVGI